ncbi:MAG: transposase [Planctomycetes bacterium]|nr:transposase [Planctomycetota bacterium]
MTFNLDPPPGFRGLDPHVPVRIYTRNLPHWRQDGATYFVTFNLDDALPGAKKNELKAMRREWELRYPPPRDEAVWTAYAKTVFQRVEKWMDAGYGRCWFRQRQYAAELQRAILHFHDQRYEIGCCTIMANHCHLIIRPFESYELEEEVGSMKSVTARFVKKAESIDGDLWQQESCERIIRDEEHLYRTVQYIGANPRRAGLPPESWCRWINPVWQSIGWDFCDDL